MFIDQEDDPGDVILTNEKGTAVTKNTKPDRENLKTAKVAKVIKTKDGKSKENKEKVPPKQNKTTENVNKSKHQINYLFL